MAASEETSEKVDERATIFLLFFFYFFFFFGWKFDLRSLYDSYGYGLIFCPGFVSTKREELLRNE